MANNFGLGLELRFEILQMNCSLRRISPEIVRHEPEPPPVVVEAAPALEAAPAAPSSRFGYRTDRVRPAEAADRGSRINLTRGWQTGPTLDDGQKGPKVLSEPSICGRRRRHRVLRRPVRAPQRARRVLVPD